MNEVTMEQARAVAKKLGLKTGRVSKWKLVDAIFDWVDDAKEMDMVLPSTVINFYNRAIGQTPLYQSAPNYWE